MDQYCGLTKLNVITKKFKKKKVFMDCMMRYELYSPSHNLRFMLVF